MDYCEHCGAVWDDRHENEGCPVASTTERILAPVTEHPPEGVVGFNGNYAWRERGDGSHDAIMLIAHRDGTVTWERR